MLMEKNRTNICIPLKSNEAIIMPLTLIDKLN